MKQETENLIGKILQVDDFQISRANDALKKVVPEVERIISEYAALQSLPAFSQKTWENILSDNGEGVCAMYRSQAAKDASQFKNAAIVGGIMNSVETSLQPLRSAIKAARKALSDAAFNQISGSLDISLSDIVIVKGSPVIDLTRVKEVYTLKIENEPQATLYKAGLEAEKALERLRELLQDTDSDPYKIGWGCAPGNAGVFIYDISTAKVEFDVTCVASAKQMAEVAE